MRLAKRHGPTLFLVLMVFFMVLVMTLALGFLDGAYAQGILGVWPKRFAVAYAIALPTAFVARRLAGSIVARLTG